MQISFLILLVLAVAVGEKEPHALVTHPTLRSAAALAIMALVVLVGHVGSIVFARRIRRSRQTAGESLRRFHRLQRVHGVLWCLAAIIVLVLLRWPQIVHNHWKLGPIWVIGDLVAFLPVWLPVLLSWFGLYEVEAAIHGLAHAADPMPGRMRFVWLQMRHLFGICLLPLVAVLFLEDLTRFVAPRAVPSDRLWPVLLIPLAVLILFLPKLLCRIWITSRLPNGALRASLENLARQMGVRCTDFRVWHTDQQLLNAVVTGLVAPVRCVLLTDALIRNLSQQQLEAVVAHELGHVRRHHLLLRMMLLSLPVVIAVAFQTVSPTRSSSAGAPAASMTVGADLSNTQQLIAAAITILYLVVTLGYYSRLLEFDADLCASRAGRAHALIGAMRRLMELAGPDRGSWLHPSITERIARLEIMEIHPNNGTRLRHRLDRLHTLLILLWATTAGWIAFATLFRAF